MEKDIELAIKFGHHLFVKNVYGHTITGIPERSDDPNILKLRTIKGSVWIPLDEVEHVSRLINLR